MNTIVLSMESEPIYEMLEPGNIYILYKEEGSYVYAINKDGGLTIERAFIPPTQVKREKLNGYVIGYALEHCEKGDIVKCCCGADDSRVGDPSTPLKDQASNLGRSDEFEEYNDDPREFSDYLDYIQLKKKMGSLKSHQPNVDQTQHAGSPDQKPTPFNPAQYL